MNMNKKWIYVDDIRIPTDSMWTVAVNYEEFVKEVTLVGLDNVEFISLDHDLGDSAMVEYYSHVKPNYELDYSRIEEKTGYDCAKWLVQESMNKKILLPTVKVHSANPIGAANIMGYINNYLRNNQLPETCTRVRFPHTNRMEMSLEERLAKFTKK